MRRRRPSGVPVRHAGAVSAPEYLGYASGSGAWNGKDKTGNVVADMKVVDSPAPVGGTSIAFSDYQTFQANCQVIVNGHVVDATACALEPIVDVDPNKTQWPKP